MSKERLEVIKEIFDIHKLQTFSDRETVPFNIKDIEWLIEQAGRVQELEEEIDRLNGALHYQLSQENIRNEENRKLKYKNKRYREAIEKAIGGCRYTNSEVAYILQKALEGEK